MSDPRFARFKTDPRFRKLHKKQNKVIVDERFKSVFSKDNQKSANKAAQVDKYGRKLSKGHDTENLRRFYRLEGNEELLASSIPDYARGGVLMESSDDDEEATAEESDSENNQPVVLGNTSRKPIPVEEEIEVDLDESQFAELDALAKINVEKSMEEEQKANSSNTEKTTRLAVVNLDWDHVKASHLYKIFSSVVSSSSKKNAPAVGKVLNVRVYPSEFGKARMEHEAKAGPPKNIFKKQNNDDQDDVEEDDGNEYDEDALRKYQLERLRYYYAIVTCDTPDTAAHIFSELDGTELERSANIFDLSYVPDEMSFVDDYTEEATEEKNHYKAVEFVTDALRHSKVKLTWDDDDPERVKMTRRTFSKKELEEADFKAFLASASSDEGSDDGDETRREKFRSLLLNEVDEDNELVPEGWGKDFDKGGGEMKITFTPGLSGSNNIADQEEETTRERYLRKQKEKRKKQKDERPQKSKQAEELLGDDFFGEDEDDEEAPAASKDNRSTLNVDLEKADTAEVELLQATLGDDREPKHFDMRAVIKAEKGKMKKRGKEKKRHEGDHADEIQEDFVLDISDPRFKALHEDHAFAIDPSNPHFKKTKNMSALLEERAKRQRPRENIEFSTKNSLSNDNDSRSLKHLVEKVKRKSSVHNDKKSEIKRRKFS